MKKLRLGLRLSETGRSIMNIINSLINYTNTLNKFVYTLDGSKNNIITNQGGSLAKYNLLLNTGEELEVLATQVFSVGDTGQTVACYRVPTATWTYHTAPYTLTADTYGHIASFSIMPSAGDKVILDANIHDIANLWFGRATGLTSIVKADIQHFYIPKVEQGNLLFDIVGQTVANANTVPVMTSNTGPSGIASVSSTIGGNYLAYRAFNRTITASDDCWHSLTVVSTRPQSITYKGKGKSVITSIKITNRLTLAANSSLEDFIAQGSLDGIVWINITSIVGATYAGDAGTNTFTFANTVGYLYHRLYVTKVSGTNQSAAISILEFIGTTDASIQIPNYTNTMYTNVDLNAKGQQVTPFIFNKWGILSGIDYNALTQNNSGEGNTQWLPNTAEYTITQTVVLDTLIGYTGNVETTTHVMTSNTAPSGVALASTEFSADYAAWKAFNKTNINTGDAWVSNAMPAFIQYQYPVPRVVDGLYIAARIALSDSSPKDFTIKASNTGAFAGEEITLATLTGELYAEGESRVFSFANNTAYLYYRVNVTAAGSGNVAIGRLEFIGAEGVYSQSSEVRTLTHDATLDKYYIDAVLQGGTPTLPNPATTLKLGKTASIGTADEIVSTTHFTAVNSVVVP